MAHYAFIDENNIVVEVIVGRDEDEVVDGISDWEKHYEEFRPGLKCIRTSYHGNIRKHFAGIGYIYNSTIDAFCAPQPFPSWILDDNARWQPPTPCPINPYTPDQEEYWLEPKYIWDEATLNWIEEPTK